MGFVAPTEYNQDLVDGISSRFREDLTAQDAVCYRVLSWLYTIITEPDNAEELLTMPYKPKSPMGYLIDLITGGRDDVVS